MASLARLPAKNISSCCTSVALLFMLPLPSSSTSLPFSEVPLPLHQQNETRTSPPSLIVHWPPQLSHEQSHFGPVSDTKSPGSYSSSPTASGVHLRSPVS